MSCANCKALAQWSSSEMHRFREVKLGDKPRWNRMEVVQYSNQQSFQLYGETSLMLVWIDWAWHSSWPRSLDVSPKLRLKQQDEPGSWPRIRTLSQLQHFSSHSYVRVIPSSQHNWGFLTAGADHGFHENWSHYTVLGIQCFRFSP